MDKEMNDEQGKPPLPGYNLPPLNYSWQKAASSADRCEARLPK